MLFLLDLFLLDLSRSTCSCSTCPARPVPLDLDGPLRTRGGPLSGAAEAVRSLRAAGHTRALPDQHRLPAHPALLAALPARGRRVEAAQTELFTALTAAEALLTAPGAVRVLPPDRRRGGVPAGQPLSTGLTAAEPSPGAARRPTDGVAVTHVVVGDLRANLFYELL
ncbi:hypothetical protein [Paractinoplanes rishiriensis]|uniref:Uncharacterized protein n=1 Tax=Paractinoplanes rishiriensis TaxID=1050105 RepID=A0A919MQA8_9ACTN|nr:hypothetical protein [Actinoplanes rishiriensis]GIE95961.1 hypothetical protein Ari01nite_34260 [Actinoplanes rishiriensis]